MTITDEQIDALVVAIQAEMRPDDTSHQLDAIDKGNQMVRRWLAHHGVDLPE